jgi:23S rRNA pseudouridine2605 synthase
LSERIQKALANAGLGSRRAIERWVVDGRITIDGRVAQLGDQVGGRERVCVDGRPVKLTSDHTREAHQHIAYYKNAEAPNRSGEASEALLEVPRPRQGRWIDVGAVDPNTSGLLILTTDGELAFRLKRPATLIEREYAVRVLGEPMPEQLRDLETGIELDDGVTRFASIEGGGGGTANNRWYHIVLREGRHRELRTALAAVGLAVSRVIRVRFGSIELGKLRRGASRPLSSAEVEGLYTLAGLAAPKPSRAQVRAASVGARPAPRAPRKLKVRGRR